MTNKSKNPPKIFLFIVVIFLTYIICSLSLLDGSEYVHCVHVDICEFMELPGNLRLSQIKKLLHFKHLSNKIFSKTMRLVHSGKEFLVNFMFLKRWLCLKRIAKLFFLKRGPKIIINRTISPINKNFKSHETLKILSTSIITC